MARATDGKVGKWEIEMVEMCEESVGWRMNGGRDDGNMYAM